MQRKHSMLLSSTSVDGWTLASTVCLCSLVKKVAGDHAAGAGALSLMQLLPMLWLRSQASLAASMMTGLRSHQRNWGIRCRLRSLAMLGLLAGVLSLVLLVRLLLLALPVLRCCRMAGWRARHRGTAKLGEETANSRTLRRGGAG